MSTKFEDLILRNTFANRPAAGKPGRLFFDTTNNVLQRDTGSTWENIEGAGGGGGGSDSDIYANLPTPATSGLLYLPTDGISVLRDDSAAWTPWGPLHPLTKPPLVANWTQVNMTGGSAVDNKGGIILTSGNTAANNYQILARTKPGTVWRVTAGFYYMMNNAQYQSLGVGFRSSSSGYFSMLAHVYDASFKVQNMTNETTFSATAATEGTWVRSNFMFIRIGDNGSSRVYEFSFDGQMFSTVYSIGRTEFLTADQAIICVNGDSSKKAKINLISWLEEDLS